MKKLLLIVATAIGLITPPALQADHSCDRKLDALSKTVLDLVTGADEVNTELTTFESTCCNRVRGESRVPSCSCTTMEITTSGSLTVPGAYCLANDIATGDIDATGLQVKINLNGHVINGSVITGPNSYVYGGTIIDTLLTSSFSHVEEVTLGGLRGSHSVGVLAHNVFFLGNDVVIHGFDSITLDNSIFSRNLRLEGIKDIIIRHSQVRGDIAHPDYGLEKMLFYDSTIAGACTLAQTGNLTNLGFWNSSALDVDVALNLVSAPYPIITAQGSVFRRFSLINSGSVVGVVGLIDECTCEQLVLTKLANIRIQNTVINAVTNGDAVVATDCEQMTFDHVQAYSTGGGSFIVNGGKNILMKQCMGSSPTSVVYTFGSSGAPQNLNVYECVAKNTAIIGFFFGSSDTTGTVIRCIADNCNLRGFEAGSDIKTVFSGNVSVNNGQQDYSGTPGAPFNPSSDPMMAVSWRNMKSLGA